MANEKLGVATEPSPESLLYGDFRFVQWGLTFLNLNKHHCFIVLHISIWGAAWSFVSEGLSHQSPPVATGLCGKTSAYFLMQLTRKST